MMTYPEYLIIVLGSLERDSQEERQPDAQELHVNSTEDLAHAMALARGRLD